MHGAKERHNIEAPMFRDAVLNCALEAREAAAMDGSDRSWVHAALLAWQRHYRICGRPMTLRTVRKRMRRFR